MLIFNIEIHTEIRTFSNIANIASTVICHTNN